MEKLFYIFKPIFSLLPNNLHLRLVKLGPRLTRSWEKTAQELRGFSRNRDHVYNSQMGIEIWFHLWKWRIYLFKIHLHSRLSKIKPKTKRIWSKKVPKNYTSSLTVRTTCTTLKQVSKYDFIFANEELCFSKITFIGGLARIDPKMIRIRSKREK
jgi:hypothetical protein